MMEQTGREPACLVDPDAPLFGCAGDNDIEHTPLLKVEESGRWNNTQCSSPRRFWSVYPKVKEPERSSFLNDEPAL